VSNQLLVDDLSARLDGATSARIDINTGSGNLEIDELSQNEQLLGSGSLEYFENQGKPTQSLTTEHGNTTLTLKGAAVGQPWFWFPWAACNGATQWHIHLNRMVSEIAAIPVVETSS
jgi:hypothetical protein